MNLTPENKAHIDSLDYRSLLSRWRFSPAGDPWFTGETGAYWTLRMADLRSRPGGQSEAVAASKALGWTP